jgi:hypothetical protein
MTAPVPPFRIDLKTALIDAGRPEEADQVYRCLCRRRLPADTFVDVRDHIDRFGTGFVCTTCASDLRRSEQSAYEVALREYEVAQGALCEEVLNDLRGRRDVALAKSDWTQLLDNRDRLGSAASALWDAYRAAVRAWFTTARDTAVIEDFPDPPGDASPSTETVSLEPET